MDIQRKKGMLEVCVLAVMKKGASYGYRIAREVEQCVDISESTLYPILKRLEQNGCLRTYRQEYNGRIRKYYCLTQEGQNKIDSFLDEWEELREMYRFVEECNRGSAAAENVNKEEMSAAEAEHTEETEETAAEPDEAQSGSAAEVNAEPECAEEAAAEPDEAQSGSAAEIEEGGMRL